MRSQEPRAAQNPAYRLTRYFLYLQTSPPENSP